ncbi:hypothetical protein VNO78_31045 [Psophocarpus tetragonolobus]|uniref:Uncharacterized protein n=1 Tax=Psophocarpus tetragonolobus TaxID=3891 RepID=A0AAN9RZ66_PSOTE
MLLEFKILFSLANLVVKDVTPLCIFILKLWNLNFDRFSRAFLFLFNADFSNLSGWMGSSEETLMYMDFGVFIDDSRYCQGYRAKVGF